MLNRLDKGTGLTCFPSLVLESCNGIWDVPSRLIEQKLVRWASGCIAHALHNFFENFVKLLFRDVTKEALFSPRESGLLAWYRSYTILCALRCWGGPTLWFFTAAPAGRQSNSCLSNFSWCKKFCAICLLPFCELFPLDMYLTYQIPANLTNILYKLSFWDSLGRASTAFHSICQAICVRKSNISLLSITFAFFLLAWAHYHQAE